MADGSYLVNEAHVVRTLDTDRTLAEMETVGSSPGWRARWSPDW